jgi:hypothetical protein
MRTLRFTMTMSLAFEKKTPAMGSQRLAVEKQRLSRKIEPLCRIVGRRYANHEPTDVTSKPLSSRTLTLSSRWITLLRDSKPLPLESMGLSLEPERRPKRGSSCRESG